MRSWGTVLTVLLAVVWRLWTEHRRADAMENRLVRERYDNAVKHLGSEKESIRMDGAHALFDLALEEKRFRNRIAKILCTHILAITNDARYREDHVAAPSAEIQTLMQLLFAGENGASARSESDRAAFWNGLRADLSGGYFRGIELADAQFQSATLTGAQFRDASLKDARFWGASLERAKFYNASLEHAQFHDANLEHAKFHDASLEHAQFHDASLEHAQFLGAELECVQFQDANLRDAQFQDANLADARFQGASLLDVQFHGAYLRGAQFHKANLEHAQFLGVDLSHIEFQGADLEFAQFWGANFADARFRGAYLPDAQFRGAVLRGACFHNANLERAQFQGAELRGTQFQGADLGGAQFQGAELADAEFQGAELRSAQFQGATSVDLQVSSFEERVKKRTGKDAALSNIVFAGGLKREQIVRWADEIKEGGWFSKEGIVAFEEKLREHVGREKSNTLPNGARGGRYGKEEADRWIEEYEKAVAKSKAESDAGRQKKPKGA